MWVLNRIRATNLMSFTELDYTLSQGVTTLVFGENLDNESQKSNGSGKSALTECIAIGLTGSPMRKVKNEEVINDAAETCDVTLELLNTNLMEKLVISRSFFRKGSSTCDVELYRDGELVTTDEAKQSSVREYDKYILSKLGLTQDELYNNFLLSKHKYQNFLSSSDKDKKEIINRFSNGNMVDEAIEKVNADMAPYTKEVEKLDLEVAYIGGKIDVVKEQIEAEINNATSKKDNLQSTIESLEGKIVEQRGIIRECNKKLDENDSLHESLKDLDEDVEDVENSEEPLHISYKNLTKLLTPFKTKDLTDWVKKSSDIQTSISGLEEREKRLLEDLGKLGERKTQLENDVKTITKKSEKFYDGFPDLVVEYDNKVSSLKEEIEDLEGEITVINKTRRNIKSSISEIQTKLTGVITCPKCNHEFSLADKDFDPDKARKEVEMFEKNSSALDQKEKVIEKNITGKETKTKSLVAEKRSWAEKRDQINEDLDKAKDALRPINKSVSDLKLELDNIKNDVELEQNKIGNIRSNMFDEVYDIVDALFDKNEKTHKQINEEVSDAEGRIEALQANIEQVKEDTETDLIKGLENSLTEHNKDLKKAVDKRTKSKSELSKLEVQSQRFVEFKTFLANTKIEALSTITNEFLENIGSDIRIKFSGFTVLKGGKVRDKISIALLRDGLDCGSFGKFSEGEKARANLASILAMQTLTNANCDLDGGLDLIVLDEILESVDENGLANMFKALNKLKITALVVSHGLVSENYPYKLVITKENGESTIKDGN